MQRFKEKARTATQSLVRPRDNITLNTLTYFIQNVSLIDVEHFNILNERCIHKHNQSATQYFAYALRDEAKQSFVKAIAVLNSFHRISDGYLSFQIQMKWFKEHARLLLRNNNNNTERQTLMYFFNTVDFSEAQFKSLNDDFVGKFKKLDTQRFAHVANEPFLKAITALNDCYKEQRQDVMHQYEKPLPKQNQNSKWHKKPATAFSLFEAEVKCLKEMAKERAIAIAYGIPSANLTQEQIALLYATVNAKYLPKCEITAILCGKWNGDYESDDEDNDTAATDVEIESNINDLQQCVYFIYNSDISERQFDMMQNEFETKASSKVMSLTEMISIGKTHALVTTITALNNWFCKIKQEEAPLKEIMNVLNDVRDCINNGSQKQAEELAIGISIKSEEQMEIYLKSVALLPIYTPKWYFVAHILLAKYREFETFGITRILAREEVQRLKEEIDERPGQSLCKSWSSICMFRKCKLYHGERLKWDDDPHGIKASRRKTTLCRYFAKGKCKFGNDCTWAHGEEDLEYRLPRSIREKPKRNITDEPTRSIIEKPIRNL